MVIENHNKTLRNLTAVNDTTERGVRFNVGITSLFGFAGLMHRVASKPAENPKPVTSAPTEPQAPAPS
ncbi:Protein of unknown function [Gryllus bimaculatus]|nr:Protein of unknown function [Gryllus bimaculatus]